MPFNIKIMYKRLNIFKLAQHLHNSSALRSASWLALAVLLVPLFIGINNCALITDKNPSK